MTEASPVEINADITVCLIDYVAKCPTLTRNHDRDFIADPVVTKRHERPVGTGDLPACVAKTIGVKAGVITGEELDESFPGLPGTQ